MSIIIVELSWSERVQEGPFDTLEDAKVAALAVYEGMTPAMRRKFDVNVCEYDDEKGMAEGDVRKMVIIEKILREKKENEGQYRHRWDRVLTGHTGLAHVAG